MRDAVAVGGRYVAAAVAPAMCDYLQWVAEVAQSFFEQEFKVLPMSFLQAPLILNGFPKSVQSVLDWSSSVFNKPGLDSSERLFDLLVLLEDM